MSIRQELSVTRIPRSWSLIPLLSLILTQSLIPLLSLILTLSLIPALSLILLLSLIPALPAMLMSPGLCPCLSIIVHGSKSV
jgi:hypothetical protein